MSKVEVNYGQWKHRYRDKERGLEIESVGLRYRSKRRVTGVRLSSYSR